MDKEQAVRDAALALQSAIADAVAAGYRVNWPGNAADLDKIEISATGKVVDELPKPQPFAARPTAKPFGDSN
jgi:hypothetical protein